MICPYIFTILLSGISKWCRRMHVRLGNILLNFLIILGFIHSHWKNHGFLQFSSFSCVLQWFFWGIFFCNIFNPEILTRIKINIKNVFFCQPCTTARFVRTEKMECRRSWSKYKTVTLAFLLQIGIEQSGPINYRVTQNIVLLYI